MVGEFEGERRTLMPTSINAFSKRRRPRFPFFDHALVAVSFLLGTRDPCVWAFHARRGDLGSLLGNVISCAARRGALPFRRKGHLFRLSGLWSLRIAEEFSRYTLFPLPPPPRILLKSDRKMGKVPPPPTPLPPFYYLCV